MKQNPRVNLDPSDELQNQTSYECDICLEARFVSSRPPCGHEICVVCLHKILKTRELHDRCGLCRSNFPETFDQYEHNFHNVADLKSEECRNAAIAATAEGNLPILKEILENDTQNSVPKKTLLMLAAAAGHVEIVKHFKEENFDLDQASWNEQTPVWIAAKEGQLEMVQFLADANVDLDRADDGGATPLWMAAQSGNIEIVKFLVAGNVGLNRAVNNGATPVMIAIQNGHIEVAKFLAEENADLTRAANNGVTPAFKAVAEGHIEIVKLLAAQNVDLDQRFCGDTLVTIAAQAGHTEIEKVLRELNGSA